jgi:hypothetical protein
VVTNVKPSWYPRSDSTKLKNRQTQVKEKTVTTADIHVVPSDVI